VAGDPEEANQMKTRTVAITIAALIAVSTAAFAQSAKIRRMTRDTVRGGFGEADNLSVTVTPHNPPVSIPSSGGHFDFALELRNDEAGTVSFEMWTMLEQPDGSMVGPLHGPSEFQLPSSWMSGNDLSSYLGPDAPAGSYTLHASLGQFPGSVWASATFALEKAESTPPWYHLTSGTTNFLFNVFFADENNGWATGMLNTILHTSDGGDNWYPQPIPPSSHYYGVHFADALEGWAVGSSGKIAYTQDGGVSWVLQPSGTNYYLYDVFFIDDTTGWIAGGRFGDHSPGRQLIMKTTNGGETWDVVFTQSYRNPLKAIHFVDANRGWAVGEGGAALHTTDGGTTWSEQDTPSLSHLEDVFFADATTGWAAGWGGALIHTTDGGTTWEQAAINTGATFTDVTFTDTQNGWVVGGEGATGGVAFRTSDGGTTWVEQDVAGAQSLYAVFFLDAEKGWAVGFDGTIIRTLTGGQ
jgi:photosystem II stability/assembly factor-like uncharacterized protein